VDRGTLSAFGVISNSGTALVGWTGIAMGKQYVMTDSCFTPEVRLGCVSIDNADQLPLDGADLIYDPETVTLALASSEAGAFSFVSINMYRFPEGLAEFKRVCEWYGNDRKLRAKLPEGVKFEKSILSVPAAPEDWDHEGYPQSNRKFVHIYRGSQQAVLIRWIARSGTILDNALFKPLVDNLRIVPGQWITDPPVVQARVGSQPKASDAALADDVRTELNEAAARARKMLNLGRVGKPEKLAQAIHAAIDELRIRKGVKADERKQLAIDYGALWGESLCAAVGWTWCRVELSSPGVSTFAVCSPTRSHAVAPLRIIFALVSHPKTDNNSLLLFNMIVSGNVPVAPARGFCWLS
jgi:hypothetical protein